MLVIDAVARVIIRQTATRPLMLMDMTLMIKTDLVWERTQFSEVRWQQDVVNIGLKPKR